MNLTEDQQSMEHLLRVYAVKGDTAGVEKALARYLEKGHVLTTRSINSILMLILNTSGELDWGKFIEIHSTYFDSGSLVANEETYTLLFSAAQKSSNHQQAIQWYDKLLDDDNVKISLTLREAFRAAVGDDDFNKYNRQLNTIRRNKLSILDNPPRKYVAPVANLTSTKIEKEAEVSTPITDGKSVEVAKSKAAHDTKSVLYQRKREEKRLATDKMNKLVATHALANDWINAEVVLNEMIESGVPFNKRSIVQMVESFQHTRNSSVAQSLLLKAKDAIHHPGNMT